MTEQSSQHNCWVNRPHTRYGCTRDCCVSQEWPL